MTVNGSQSGRTFIKFLFIDTVLMCGNTQHDQVAGQPQFTSQQDRLDSNDYFKAFETELQHVTETEQINYLFVAGHFPVWSIAEHGPTQCLVENLRPLLHKYNVSGYLSGHDHNLQHISDVYKGSRVEYFLSGAANFIDNSTEHMKSVPAGSLKFHYGDASGVVNGGLCLFKATQSNLTVTYLDSKGLELYQTVIHPRD
jgi:tartrate-resistant acid phosphatase type 5